MSDKLIQAATDYLQHLEAAEHAHVLAADDFAGLSKRLSEDGERSLADAILTLARLHRVGALQANARAEAVMIVVSENAPDP